MVEDLTSLVELWGAEEGLSQFIEHLSSPILIVTTLLALITLIKGADRMIESAVAIAEKWGLPPIIIAATLLSLGTTVPEVSVSVMAAAMGNSSLSLGNGVGSIIADTALILGLSIIIGKIRVDRDMLFTIGRWQIGAALLLVLLSTTIKIVAPESPHLGRPVGALFLALLGLYLFSFYRWATKRGGLEKVEKKSSQRGSNIKNIALLFGGTVLVAVGSRVLVPSATEIARRVGVPNDIIAATMIALGTSLPELASMVTAIRKGHPDIVLGNIIGADVLNCFFVIGASAVVKPLSIGDTFFKFHFPVMITALLSMWFFALKGGEYFKKGHGIWLVALYVGYIAVQYIIFL